MTKDIQTQEIVTCRCHRVSCRYFMSTIPLSLPFRGTLVLSREETTRPRGTELSNERLLILVYYIISSQEQSPSRMVRSLYAFHIERFLKQLKVQFCHCGNGRTFSKHIGKNCYTLSLPYSFVKPIQSKTFFTRGLLYSLIWGCNVALSTTFDLRRFAKTLCR